MDTAVTVIIPTYERPDAVRQCLESLADQRRQPDQVLLVDDSPGKAVEREAERADRDMPFPVDHTWNPGQPSLTRARNHGIAQTDSDVVAFFDSDAIIDGAYLDEAVRTLRRHPEAMAVRGIEEDRTPAPAYYRAYRWLFAQPFTGRRRTRVGFPPTFTQYATDVPDVQTSPSMKGSNMVIRRKAFDEVRFDPAMERYALFEDLDFALSLRAAYPDSILVNPRMRVHHAIDDAGRIPDDDLWLMHYVHKHYLAHKHFNVGPARRAKLWWSDIGYVVMRMGADPRRLPGLWRKYRRARGILFRHGDDLERGDLSPLNRHYSWMRDA